MKKLFKSSLILVSCLVLLGAIAIGVLFGVSKTAQLDESRLPAALAAPTFFALDGTELKYETSSKINSSEIPETLKNAFIALEDKRFYSHHGYDAKRIIGATAKNLKAKSIVEGASTITQQLIKNTHLTSEKTIKRKINEVYLAIELEKRFSKDEILAMYLSAIYFGGGVYGVKDAADLYFSKKLDELTVSECATLAGIVKNPSVYSPKNSLAKSQSRRNLVLKLMREQNYIDETQYASSVNEEIVLSTQQKVATGEKIYLKQCVKEIAERLNITTCQLENSGLKIYTYFDRKAQEILLNEIKEKNNYASQNIDGAASLVDNKTMGVIAYYSTIPYSFRRQPGSVIKPLVVYAPAFEKRFITCASPIKDEKINFGGYSPSNFNGIYYGWTTPREAIKKSMNSVAVKTMSYIGSDTGFEYGKKFGLNLNEKDNSLSLALGGLTDGVTVAEMAASYATFANGGIYSKPCFIRRITDKDGNPVELQSERWQAISQDTSAIMTDILYDTVKSGTARTLSTLPFQVAAKTGTAGIKDGLVNSDAWNVSFTTKHTLAVWHGGEKITETGGGHPTMSAKEIWKNFYKSGELPQDFVLPDSVKPFEIDLYALENEQRVLLAGENTPKKHTKTELFSVSNFPNEQSEIFKNITCENLFVEVMEGVIDFNNKFFDKKSFDFDGLDNSLNDGLNSNGNFDNNNFNGNNSLDNGNSSGNGKSGKGILNGEENYFDEYSYEENANENFVEFDNSIYDFIKKYNEKYPKSEKNINNQNDKKKKSQKNSYEPNNFIDSATDSLFASVKISFDAKDIFGYKIERIIDGKSTVIKIFENTKGTAEYIDNPALFFSFVTYKVTPYLNHDGLIIEGVPSSCSVYLENAWD